MSDGYLKELKSLQKDFCWEKIEGDYSTGRQQSLALRPSSRSFGL